ncbi:hypothetical protein U3516DRAFT_827508 [Neocallimastix sp. 'constans']
MKFQSILLLIATLALATSASVEISEEEDGAITSVELTAPTPTDADITEDEIVGNEVELDADEQSDDDESYATKGTIAAGVAGVAAVSSAGLFLWVKRSKRSKTQANNNNTNNNIAMV